MSSLYDVLLYNLFVTILLSIYPSLWKKKKKIQKYKNKQIIKINQKGYVTQKHLVFLLIQGVSTQFYFSQAGVKFG